MHDWETMAQTGILHGNAEGSDTSGSKSIGLEAIAGSNEV